MEKKLKKEVNALYHHIDGKRIKCRNKFMIGDCTGLRGDCTGIHGDCKGLWGNCTGIRGDCTGFHGNTDECHLTDKERKKGVYISELIR
jgi:hypothetical protein